MGKLKAFMEVPRLEAGYRPLHERIHDFGEVEQTLNSRDRMAQASRCMDCGVPFCHWACPLGNKDSEWNDALCKGDWELAYRLLNATNDFPEFTGRICPALCEKACVLNLTDHAPVTNRENEAAITETAWHEDYIKPMIFPRNGKSVAVIGAGPAGLVAANRLNRMGYAVTVFDKNEAAGGLLRYGIPNYRLPDSVLDDFQYRHLELKGIKVRPNTTIGKTITIAQLEKEGYKGIFVGSGAGLPNFMGIKGENAINIMSSNEYLTRVNLMDAANPNTDTPLNIGKHVIVVGGGNTAMDSCRTAKRLGGDVTLVYRRSEAEMPARLEEVKHAKEEGIRFLTLHNPIEYVADEKGAVKSAILQVMELGEPDASGRRSPVPVEGKTVELEVDQVIVAVGVSPNPLVPKSVEGLELGRKNTISVNENMQSSIPTIFAGGDIVRGGATVILAMGDGRRAAKSMNEYIKDQK